MNAWVLTVQEHGQQHYALLGVFHSRHAALGVLLDYIADGSLGAIPSMKMDASRAEIEFLVAEGEYPSRYALREVPIGELYLGPDEVYPDD